MMKKIIDENLQDVVGGINIPGAPDGLIQYCPKNCGTPMTISNGMYYCSKCNAYFVKDSLGNWTEYDPNTANNFI